MLSPLLVSSSLEYTHTVPSFKMIVCLYLQSLITLTAPAMEKYRLIILVLKIISGLLFVFDNAAAPAGAELTHET